MNKLIGLGFRARRRGRSGVFIKDDNSEAVQGVFSALYFDVAGGQIKTYLAGVFTAKPIKVWSGASWVVKPIKRWNGAVWVQTPY
jgi:hypothetical protein